MNDDQTPALPDDADLVASARLDGDLGIDPGSVAPAEVDRRSRELRAVVDRLHEPVALPAANVIDDQIARALAALDEVVPTEAGDSTVTEGDDSPAAVVPLAAARSRRTGRGRWMAAAAAVAIAAVIAGAVALTNRPHTSTFDTVAAPVGGATSSTAAPSAAAGRSNSEDVAPSTTTSSSAQSSTADTLPDLGAVASEEALGAEVKQQDPALMATSESTSAPTTTAVSAPAPSTTSTVSSLSPLHSPIPATTCDAAVRAATPGLGTLVYAATAMYQGIHVEVLVYQAGEPSTYRLIGARTDTCAVLVDRAL